MFSSARRKLVALGGAAPVPPLVAGMLAEPGQAVAAPAAKLTHINYAFGNVSGGKCVLGDVEADTSKFCDAASSVDGKTDSWDAGALRGNVNQWWSYDTPSTIGGKITYAKNQNLGGVFFRELSGDTTNGELITAVKNNVG